MIPILTSFLHQETRGFGSAQELALLRLNALSPAEARAFILEDAQRETPRFPARVLGILPDKQLPELDGVLLQHLDAEHGNLEAIAGLIQRYASPALYGPVESFYDKVGSGKWACGIQTALLAYMLRVQPDAAVQKIKEGLSARNETGCYMRVLSDVARLQPAAVLQQIAVEALEDADAEVVSDAANTLAIVGDADSKSSLWQRLLRWHQEWAGHKDELVFVPGRDRRADDRFVDEALLSAICTGAGWLLDPETCSDCRRWY
jgi:hypothetical protein